MTIRFIREEDITTRVLWTTSKQRQTSTRKRRKRKPVIERLKIPTFGRWKRSLLGKKTLKRREFLN